MSTPSLPSREGFLEKSTELDTCAICLFAFDVGHLPVRYTAPDNCNHIFGAGCLQEWLLSSNDNANKCPTCRREVYRSERVVDDDYGGDNWDEEYEPIDFDAMEEGDSDEDNVRMIFDSSGEEHDEEGGNGDERERADFNAHSSESEDEVHGNGEGPADDAHDVVDDDEDESEEPRDSPEVSMSHERAHRFMVVLTSRLAIFP